MFAEFLLSETGTIKGLGYFDFFLNYFTYQEIKGKPYQVE